LTTGTFQTPPLEGAFISSDGSGHFAYLRAIDASGDDTPATVFWGGALRVNYAIVLDPSAGSSGTVFLAPVGGNDPLPPPPPPPPLPLPSPLDHVTVEAWQGTSRIADLGTFKDTIVNGGLVNLADTPSLARGTYTIKATAFFKNGSVAVATVANPLQVKGSTVREGNSSGETFVAQPLDGNGVVIHGNGGTDTLDLQVDRDLVASLNGKPLSAFTPTAGGQAIYQGLAVDYLRLTDGREIYFTGIENLTVLAEPVLSPDAAFVGGIGGPLKFPETIRLAVAANDPDYPRQWNLHATDVPDAWRFTQGSSQVLLVSLDTGVFQVQQQFPPVLKTVGLPAERLIADSNDDDDVSLTSALPAVQVGHGHQAISVMIGTPNDGLFQTGINWVSNVFVADVYGGEATLQGSIREALDYARARGLKVVFQGGIQGEPWLNQGGTQADLEELFRNNGDVALFAIAAGNGGIDLNETDPANPSVRDGFSGGVARLAAEHGNVMAVGALMHTKDTVNGLENARMVFPAGYSNFGSSLTLVAPTDSLATSFVSDTAGTGIFDGTSCANPNLAAMASLVWSAYPALTAGQVRQILEQTALDLGSPGRDDLFGHGVVDAGEAVRRAVALAHDSALANLAFNPSTFVASVGAPSNGSPSGADSFPRLESDVLARLDVVPTTAPTPPRAALLARVVKQQGQSLVKIFDAATGALRKTLKPFGSFRGKVQVALIDVNGDGAPDLVVTARIGRKVRKKVYALDLSEPPSPPA
jgi:hypothetical protein